MSGDQVFALARRALRAYRLRPTGLTPLGDAHFRVDAARGPFVLRVGPPRSASRLHTRTEVAWLDRLSGADEVQTPIPVLNRDGHPVTTVGSDDAPGRHDCVLFEWTPGHRLGDAATPFDWGLLGESAAHLHEQGAAWSRRSGLRPLVWDEVCWVSGEPSVLFSPEHARLLTKRRRRVIDRANRKVGTELRRLHRGPTHLLHGDLHPGKAHLHRGELHIVGFERVMLGAPVQDLAIALRYAQRRRDYASVLEAFVDGYRSVRDWPLEYGGQINLLGAGLDLVDLNRSLLNGTATSRSVQQVVERLARVVE